MSDVNYSDLLNILNLKKSNIIDFEYKIRKFADIAAQQHKIYLVFRIARELQDIGYDTQDIEQYIINSKNAYFIYRYAREIKNADIVQLQNAIIDCKNFNYLARFGCFVPEADAELIQNLIYLNNNANAAYIYLKYSKIANINKLKKIFIKSKKPRYLYALAHFVSDLKELEYIENLLINAHSDRYIRLFAANIPGANISKLEDRLLKTKNIKEMKYFVQQVPTANKVKKYLLLMC